MISGSVRVELSVKGRPQAVVIGQRKGGDLFGERSLLNGGNAAASVVVDSDEAIILRITSTFLQQLFTAHPETMSKFFCLLAIDQAKRLTKLTKQFTDHDHTQVVLPEGLHAPTDMPSLLKNAAYLTILTRYVQSRRKGMRKALPTPAGTPKSASPAKANGAASRKPFGGGGGGGSTPKKAGEKPTPRRPTVDPATAEETKKESLLTNQLAFVTELRALRAEPDPSTLRAIAATAFTKFLSKDARKQVGCLSEDESSRLEATGVQTPGTGQLYSMPSSAVRSIFDEAEAAVIRAIDSACLSDFLASSHYNYILALIMKQQHVPSMEQFKATRVLGEGGFGQVLEVVKRDCGKLYAMKVMKKAELMSAFVGEVSSRSTPAHTHAQSSPHLISPPCSSLLVYTLSDTGLEGDCIIRAEATGLRTSSAHRQPRIFLPEHCIPRPRHGRLPGRRS